MTWKLCFVLSGIESDVKPLITWLHLPPQTAQMLLQGYQPLQNRKTRLLPLHPQRAVPREVPLPSSPAPSGDAPPTSKATPPKSPRPSSLTKKSPPTAAASSPKSQDKSEGGETGMDEEKKKEEEKAEEKEKFLEKVPRKEEAVSPKQDKKGLQRTVFNIFLKPWNENICLLFYMTWNMTM